MGSSGSKEASHHSTSPSSRGPTSSLRHGVCFLAALAVFALLVSGIMVADKWNLIDAQQHTLLASFIYGQSRGGVRATSFPPLPSATPLPRLPITDLLQRVHPLAPYRPNATDQDFLVVLGNTWFSGEMPYFTGKREVCPASGCAVTMLNSNRAGGPARQTAHAVVYHLGTNDYYGDVNQIAPPSPAMPGQLVSLFVAEGFNLAEQPAQLFARFNSDFSFRPTSWVRDTYVLWFLNDAVKQGLGPQAPLRLDARVWGDIWEAPLPWEARLTTPQASWASHYCSSARSNREDLVRDLLAAGLNISIFGEGGNCLRNVNETMLASDRLTQFRFMRSHLFHLAFENHRIQGYVSEKFYWALLRGQVPVVWGAPDIARYAPGPGSYIDAAAFNSTRELADYLLHLSQNRAEYESYHAWRKERSFDEYGDILREELVEMIWVGNATMVPTEWFNCRVCHALMRWRAAHGFTTPLPMGIPTIADTQAARYERQIKQAPP